MNGDDSFANLGVDSIRAMEIIEQLEDVLGYVIPTSTLYEHPTLRALARHIASHHGSRSSPRSKGPRALVEAGFAV